MSKASRRQRNAVRTHMVNENHIVPRTPQQAEFVKSIYQNDISFGIGPAGSGKTFLASSLAAKALNKGQIEGIVVCRPIIQAAGEDLGYLPGTLEEKADPYLRPMFDVFKKFWGQNEANSLKDNRAQGKFEYLLNKGVIEVCPLAFMRGRSFENKWILCDEAQNMSPDMMKMLLTRLGEGSKIIVTGDPRQKDISSANGFDVAYKKLRSCDSVGFTHFGLEDVVRHNTVKSVLDCWDKAA